jgi:hypothetical protein
LSARAIVADLVKRLSWEMDHPGCKASSASFSKSLTLRSFPSRSAKLLQHSASSCLQRLPSKFFCMADGNRACDLRAHSRLLTKPTRTPCHEGQPRLSKSVCSFVKLVASRKSPTTQLVSFIGGGASFDIAGGKGTSRRADPARGQAANRKRNLQLVSLEAHNLATRKRKAL